MGGGGRPDNPKGRILHRNSDDHRPLNLMSSCLGTGECNLVLQGAGSAS